MSDLKPCPFCGGKPDTEIIYLSSAFSRLGEFDLRKPIVNVGCSHCGIAISYRPDFWNTRPAEDAKDKEIERMEAVIAEIGAMTLTGVDDVEDFIFMLCKDTVSDEAIKQAYRKYLENDIAKMTLGTDTNAPANAPDMNDGKMEE